MLTDTFWVARDGEMVPHLDVKYVNDEYDQASLNNRITARLPTVDKTLPVGPLELQIAYKLYLGTQKDFEDAVHLYILFKETLKTAELKQWTEELDVESEYARLERA